VAKYILVNLDFDGVSRIMNLPNAVSGSEPVTLNQLNAALEGVNWKDSVRAASTGNVTISGPGTSLDAITLANGDRVLLKNQTLPAENGIYIFNGSGTALTRAPDANTFTEVEAAVVIVEEGTANLGTSWRQTQVNGTLGTNDILFTAFLAGAPDASETTKGIAEIATQAEVDGGTDDARFITPIKLKNSKWFSQSKIFTIGDGSATSFNCDHNLSTRAVQTEVFRNSGNYDSVVVETSRPTVNRVTVGFTAAPASNAYIAVVQGQLN
jgi:hypothetical protein